MGQIYGGFYSLVDRQGRDKSDPKVPKNAYGNAFAIYALAAYYHATRDTSAINLAKKAFLWLEKNSYDPLHKGYYQHLKRDGTPIVRDANVIRRIEQIKMSGDTTGGAEALGKSKRKRSLQIISYRLPNFSLEPLNLSSLRGFSFFDERRFREGFQKNLGHRISNPIIGVFF